jgi:2-C-methyl-D-erythritol 2,4-cyclodiphosphate synthase
MTLRTGIGIDVHPLVEGRPLVLGGVVIPFEKGLEGNSDGDVLIHAVIDALLGAAAFGDIGTHFPPGDERYLGIASGELLTDTMKMLEAALWRVEYVDATILAERPILRPFMGQMKRSMAQLLGLSEGSLNLKATTTDGLGYIGRGEGISCTTVATITRTE